MDCPTKNGLLIFLLVLCGCLSAVIGAAIIVFCRRKRSGGGKKQTQRNFNEEEKNISTVSQGIQYQDTITEKETAETQSEPGGVSRVDGVFDLRELPKDDDLNYQSAREGSITDYGSVLSLEARAPSVISFHREKEPTPTNVSFPTSSSSSSSSSPSSTREPVQIDPKPEAIYANVVKTSKGNISHVPPRSPTISSSSSSSSSSYISSDKEGRKDGMLDHMEMVSQYTDSDTEEEDMIIAEYTGTSQDIAKTLDVSDKEEEGSVEWMDLGTDTEWAQRQVDRMEEDDPDWEIQHTVTITEVTNLPRRSSESSQSSDSSSVSSSSSNSPSKTLAEADISLPLSHQIISELQTGDFRYSANYISHITNDLKGKNNSQIYEIEEEEETDIMRDSVSPLPTSSPLPSMTPLPSSSPLPTLSSPPSPNCQSVISPLIQSNTPIIHLSPPILPVADLCVDPSSHSESRSRILSDITEVSETGNSRRTSNRSSGSESDTGVHRTDGIQKGVGTRVRRSSSGITSSATSILRLGLSTEYESVYSKDEEAKRKSREETYKNLKMEPRIAEDSAA